MLQVNGSFHPQVHNVFLAMGRSVVDRCITMLPIRHGLRKRDWSPSNRRPKDPVTRNFVARLAIFLPIVCCLHSSEVLAGFFAASIAAD